MGALFPNRIDLGLGRASGTDQKKAHAIKPGFIQATQTFPEDIEKIQNYFSPENKTAIEAGKQTDMIILNSNPLLDIKSTQDIYSVLNDGEYFNREALDTLLKQAKKTKQNVIHLIKIHLATFLAFNYTQ